MPNVTVAELSYSPITATPLPSIGQITIVAGSGFSAVRFLRQPRKRMAVRGFLLGARK